MANPGVVVSNRFIESLIGSPIPRYNEAADRIPQGIYSIVRPAILTFFHFCNDPQRNPANIYQIMDGINNLGMAQINNQGQNLMQRAINAGLVPNGAGLTVDVWKQRWFDDLFSNPGMEPKIIVQGGEAVNSYVYTKYENVQTHDADTRLLIGDHFHYLAELRNINRAAKVKMHKFRFFVTIGLVHFVQWYISMIQTPGAERFDYTTPFLPEWNAPAATSFNIPFRGDNYVNKILDENYDINDDTNLERLIPIVLNIHIQNQAPMQNNGIVDLFIPYKIPDDTMIGQSNSIHTFFATGQAGTILNGGLAVPAGRVPSTVFHLPFKANIPVVGGSHINLTIVPHGFILFETIRMLLVSHQMEVLGVRNTKRVKYMQKLVTLLTTLLSDDISHHILRTVGGGNTTSNPAVNPYLSGGGNSNKIESVWQLANQAEMTSKNITTQENNLDPRELEEARAFSRKLMDMDVSLLNEPIDTTNFTPTQMKGYLDYMSYNHPDFKDYRLPISQEDLAGRFKPITMPKSTKKVEFFLNKEGANIATRTKGGKRKTRRTKRKN